MSLTRSLILLGVLMVLGPVNWSILGKERIKRDGAIVYLDLAPMDPRSIMQGDYMALRFRLADEIQRGVQSEGREGQVRIADVQLDDKRIARLAPSGTPGALKFRYRVRKGSVWLGTNAFFFEEGSDERYSAARYGEFRVDADSGEAVLVGLRSQSLEPL
jgi:uncharacterized membrane-anchored protein